MKKKLKDLTSEEMSKICIKHTHNGIVHCENTTCPLHYANYCLKGFIEKLHYIERQIETDER